MSGPIVLVIRILLSAALYGFLGWALWLLWSDLKAAGRSASVRPAPPISLESEAEAFSFSVSEVLIGRDRASDLYLTDGTISAHHTRLSYHHGQWWVQDLNSRNGTFLNEEPVVEPVVLTSGDRLKCGAVDLQVNIGE
jgi:hypothetical protein